MRATAQTTHAHDSHSHPATTSSTGQAEASSAFTDAVVRKIDRTAGKLTLTHAEIKHLDMPPMTMVFQVRDKRVLETLQVGANVQVRVVQDQGKLVVAELRPRP